MSRKSCILTEFILWLYALQNKKIFRPICVLGVDLSHLSRYILKCDLGLQQMFKPSVSLFSVPTIKGNHWPSNLQFLPAMWLDLAQSLHGHDKWVLVNEVVMELLGMIRGSFWEAEWCEGQVQTEVGSPTFVNTWPPSTLCSTRESRRKGAGDYFSKPWCCAESRVKEIIHYIAKIVVLNL